MTNTVAISQLQIGGQLQSSDIIPVDRLVGGVLTTIQVTAGTLTPSAISPNLIYAGPTTGVSAIPTFRSLVAADFPTNLTAIALTIGSITTTNLYAPNASIATLTAGVISMGTVGSITTGSINTQSLSVPTFSISALTATSATIGTFNGGQQAGIRNRILNGDMKIDQVNEGASQTITAAAALAYTVDQWAASCTGANVTGQRVAGTGADQFTYKFTGAASVTNITFVQPIESFNIYDLASTTVTLSAKLANSLLTSVVWTAYYPSALDNFTSKTSIASGTFTVTTTPTVYTTQIALPSNVTNGLEIAFSVGAQTSGTWTITDVQVEAGSTATPFERLPVQDTLAKLQRYYEKSYSAGVVPGTVTTAGQVAYVSSAGTTACNFYSPYKVTKRAVPSATLYSPSAGSSGNIDVNGGPFAATAGNIGTNAFGWATNSSYGEYGCGVHWTASARITP